MVLSTKGKVLVTGMASSIMSVTECVSFLFHNNASGPIGDPGSATDYYNFLRGIWKDGTPMTFGGNGYDPTNPNAIPAGYMFPGDTDPLNWGTDGVDPGCKFLD